MSEIQKIDWKGESRVETGPVQFGEDWPGVFLRGDYAVPMAFTLERMLKNSPDMDVFSLSMIEGLIKTLKSCRV